jgi:hypothetical protein
MAQKHELVLCVEIDAVLQVHAAVLRAHAAAHAVRAAVLPESRRRSLRVFNHFPVFVFVFLDCDFGLRMV